LNRLAPKARDSHFGKPIMVTIPLLELPSEIAALQQIALDLRWTWSHEGDAIWGHIDEKLWERTLNPWTVLQGASRERLKQLSQDQKFLDQLNGFVGARNEYLNTPGWFRNTQGTSKLGGVAYFSMEFGECGGFEKPRDGGTEWLMQPRIGVTGQPLPDFIRVDKRTGAVRYGSGPSTEAKAAIEFERNRLQKNVERFSARGSSQ